MKNQKPRYTPYLTSHTQQWAPPDPDHSGNEHLRDPKNSDLLWYLGWAYLDGCWAHWVATNPRAQQDMRDHPHLRRKPSTCPGGVQGVFPYDDCVISASGQVTHWGVGTYHDWVPADQATVVQPQVITSTALKKMLASIKSQS